DIDRDPVEPAGERFLTTDGTGFPRQHQESSLESLLRGVGVPKEPAGDSEDQRAVAQEQGREGVLVTLGYESPEQLRVTEVGVVFRDRGPPQVPQNLRQGWGGHARPFSLTVFVLLLDGPNRYADTLFRRACSPP